VDVLEAHDAGQQGAAAAADAADCTGAGGTLARSLDRVSSMMLMLPWDCEAGKKRQGGAVQRGTISTRRQKGTPNQHPDRAPFRRF
jgi:hypothetical protein